MPAKKAEPKAKKILTSVEAKTIFSVMVTTFTDHYIDKHAKALTKKAIRQFSDSIVDVIDDLEIVEGKDNKVIVTVADTAEDKLDAEE